MPGGFKVGGDVQWGSSDTTRNPSRAKAKTSLGMGIDVEKGDSDTRVAEAEASGEVTWTWDAGENKDKEGVDTKAGVKGGGVGAEEGYEASSEGGNTTVKREEKALAGYSEADEVAFVDGEAQDPKRTITNNPSVSDTAGELWDLL